jgi:hypothetical protein
MRDIFSFCNLGQLPRQGAVAVGTPVDADAAAKFMRIQRRRVRRGAVRSVYGDGVVGMDIIPRGDRPPAANLFLHTAADHDIDVERLTPDQLQRAQNGNETGAVVKRFAC